MELWVANATVVTLNARRDVLRGAHVVIRDGRIVHVGAKPPPRSRGVRQRIDASVAELAEEREAVKQMGLLG